MRLRRREWNAANLARLTAVGDLLMSFCHACIAVDAPMSIRVVLDEETLALLADYASADDTLEVTTERVRDGFDVHTQVLVVNTIGEHHQILIAVGEFRRMTQDEYAEMSGLKGKQ